MKIGRFCYTEASEACFCKHPYNKRRSSRRLQRELLVGQPSQSGREQACTAGLIPRRAVGNKSAHSRVNPVELEAQSLPLSQTSHSFVHPLREGPLDRIPSDALIHTAQNMPNNGRCGIMRTACTPLRAAYPLSCFRRCTALFAVKYWHSVSWAK